MLEFEGLAKRNENCEQKINEKTEENTKFSQEKAKS